MTRVGMLQLQKLEFESQAAAISARPSSQYCNCTKWDKNPIKKIFIKKYYYVKMYYNVKERKCGGIESGGTRKSREPSKMQWESDVIRNITGVNKNANN